MSKVLTAKKLKELLANVPDNFEVAVDYPTAWNDVHQVYTSDNKLWLVASSSPEDSGIGSSIDDALLWDGIEQ